MLRICFAFVLIFWPVVAVAQIAGTVRVIDADTVDVGDTRIRLHAIDAPEMDQNCETEHGVAFACGQWATAQVRARFGGAHAVCTPSDFDTYGRIVATCRVQGVDMGEEIVAHGWAFAFRRYGMEYDLTEKAAFVSGQGLHGLRVQSPAEFRRAKVAGRAPVDPHCLIKGNISRNGRIFHVPGQEFYDQTGINEGRGERWFCSEGEARRAGWRPALR
jgi:endonuclease YncB( thermonuclease family)